MKPYMLDEEVETIKSDNVDKNQIQFMTIIQNINLKKILKINIKIEKYL